GIRDGHVTGVQTCALPIWSCLSCGLKPQWMLYPGAQPVEQNERAEVDELLSWLSDADLPNEPFQLWPWQRVVDLGRLIVMLQTEIGRASCRERVLVWGVHR